MDLQITVNGWYDAEKDVVEIAFSDPDQVDFYEPQPGVWVFFDATTGHLSGLTLEDARQRVAQGTGLSLSRSLLGPAFPIVDALVDREPETQVVLGDDAVAALVPEWDAWHDKLSGSLATAG